MNTWPAFHFITPEVRVIGWPSVTMTCWGFFRTELLTVPGRGYMAMNTGASWSVQGIRTWAEMPSSASAFRESSLLEAFLTSQCRARVQHESSEHLKWFLNSIIRYLPDKSHNCFHEHVDAVHVQHQRPLHGQDKGHPCLDEKYLKPWRMILKHSLEGLSDAWPGQESSRFLFHWIEHYVNGHRIEINYLKLNFMYKLF